MAEIKYSVTPILQNNSKCCWLACYQMLYTWNNQSASEVAPKIKAVGISTDEGLDISQWGTARTAVGLTGYRVSFLKEYANFVDIFTKHGPMWCAGNFLNGDPHAILIVGADPDSKRLRYLDPYKLWQNGGEGYEYMMHDKWCTQIKAADFATQMWFDKPKGK
ncbi:MAG TPA: papain-like cysteine protease family protein [Pirellulaceae bacterium]|nr:papain-like cysteine protease family protein [Pirellulaceae bacterium]